MFKQSNLFGEKLELPTPNQLKEQCCEACYMAKEKVCVCKCHGRFHALGALNKRNKLAYVNLPSGRNTEFS